MPDDLPPSSDAPSGQPPRSGSDREQALIAGALKQASPRPGSASFPLRPREIDKNAIPGYEILREIHRGGQGVVYQALQKSTQRKVAIKVVHGGPFAGPRERARVEREVRILAGLDHPNIVKIHDSGEVPGAAGTGGGTFYYVMDYVSGHSLDALISKDQKPVADVLRLFVDIADAVSAAHLKGVIHRDLKPSNIRVDPSGKPHVLDFGLAKLSIPDESDGHRPRVMTMTGQFIGSLPWASPEQATGAPGAVDIRTDVYSLGVMLYQVLTGRFPYQVVGQMREVLDNILTVEPARPSTVRKQVNDEVETIVLKCLAKEPERRYQSAGELARDLRRYLAGEPIEAKRDSGWYFVTKTLRRHRVAVGVATGFLVLLVLFSAAMSLMWSRERDLRALAERRREETLIEAKAKEAARAQAHANFESVRDLARVFMQDFSEGIEDLRGATPVRVALLQTAQVALAKLAAQAESRESGGDAGTDAPNVDLLRELADAHERVGEIEAGLYLSRVGKTASGAAHYARAREIRERLLAVEPAAARAMADVAASRRRTAQVLQRERRLAEARPEFEQSISTFDAALALAHAGEAPEIRRRRMEAVVGLANLFVTMSVESAADAVERDRLIGEATARYTQAEEFWRSELRADPADRLALRQIGSLIDARARALTARARFQADGAFASARAGQRERAVLEFRAARETLASARAAAAQAAEQFRELSARRPQDALVRRDLMIATYNIGDAHMREGDMLERALESEGVIPPGGPAPGGEARAAHTQGAQEFRAALVIAEELANADQANLEARRDLVLVLNKLGNVVRDLGSLEEAAAIFQRSLELREDLWRTDPMEQHHLDLAVGLYKRAEVDRLLAQSAAEGPARAALRLSVRTLLSRCLQAYETLAAAGVAVRDADIARVRRELEAAEQAGGGNP
ncbi:MAG: protein kinase [Phycisphaerales bacterium]